MKYCKIKIVEGKKKLNFGKEWGAMPKNKANASFIQTGNGMYVIDIDSKKIPKKYKKWVKSLGKPTVETARGYHYYIKSDVVIKTSTNIFDDVNFGVDIRGKGGLVLNGYWGKSDAVSYKKVGKSIKDKKGAIYKSLPAKATSLHSVVKKKVRDDVGKSDVKEVKKYLKKLDIHDYSDRETWMRVLASIYHGLGDKVGRKLAKKWSKADKSQWNKEYFDDMWDNKIVNGDFGEQITIGTLYHAAGYEKVDISSVFKPEKIKGKFEGESDKSDKLSMKESRELFKQSVCRTGVSLYCLYGWKSGAMQDQIKPENIFDVFYEHTPHASNLVDGSIMNDAERIYNKLNTEFEDKYNPPVLKDGTYSVKFKTMVNDIKNKNDSTKAKQNYDEFDMSSKKDRKEFIKFYDNVIEAKQTYIDAKVEVSSSYAELLTYVDSYNYKPSTVEYGNDPFAKNGTCEVFGGVMKIMDNHILGNKYEQGRFEDDWGSRDKKMYKKVVADYKEHFPKLDEFLNLMVAVNIAKNAKAGSLFMNLPSDWGKGFLVKALNWYTPMMYDGLTVDTLKNVAKGVPSGLDVNKLRKSFGVMVEEVNYIPKEFKQLDENININVKNSSEVSIKIGFKVMTNKEEIRDLDGTHTDEQFANRINLWNEEVLGDDLIKDRNMVQKYGMGRGIYEGMVALYIYKTVSKIIKAYVLMGKKAATSKAAEYVNEFHEKYKISAGLGDAILQQVVKFKEDANKRVKDFASDRDPKWVKALRNILINDKYVVRLGELKPIIDLYFDEVMAGSQKGAMKHGLNSKGLGKIFKKTTTRIKGKITPCFRVVEK